jgi:hypothetical protein
MNTVKSSWIIASILSVFACDGSNNNDVRAANDNSGGAGGMTGLPNVIVCVPGTTQQCVGPGSCSGAQSCSATGTAWSSCDCGAAGSTGGSGNAGGSTSRTSTGGALATGGAAATGGSSSSCLAGPGPSNACWYQPWANGSCTASLVSASVSDIAASFGDQSSVCNAGVGFSGMSSATLNLSAYSYVSVSAQAGSGAYFNVQLTDTLGQYCYWSFTGTGATKTYLVDLASPSYCGSLTIAKAQITNMDFTTNYEYTGNYTLHVFSITFM